ncbi:MAG TPA: hypothetical protein VE338_09300 [Ktedonobacterales bacterium]|nr:hypothetical protein [Ktedonobacterales bacterium]
MTPFWIVIIALGVLAAIVNFAIAAARRGAPMVVAVRVLAGLVSLAASAGIVVGKEASLVPVILPWPLKLISAGVFVFAVMFVPSVIGKNSAESEVTLQQRAARPVNATVRLREQGADPWVN